MKRIIVLLITLSLLLGGCAAFKNIFCSPAAALIDTAIGYAAQLAALQPFYPAGTAIGNAILAAKPGVDKIKDGYCVSDQDNFLLYVQGLIDSADQLAVARGQFKGLKAMGLR